MVIRNKGGVLAIDHGTKRTGFAAADPLRIAVRALETWRGPGESAELVEHVAKLLAERDVTTLVLGLPRNMDGS
jgi:putative Holliday junction resolvase